ncbi:hypothetical protein [Alkalihalobacillus sp. BA299]|uniref:hypothetical protein n=1 Tax=Alkalihalobacillus sp. BA299 TaxID=2815938 RepID=UPI001AD95301|nr:hypothetical protein [Alkalihalobacillus sp. BA299]
MIRKNGEVIFQGKLYIYRLIFGMPALIIISENENISPKVFKTGNVTSILPHYEFLEGEQQPTKLIYQIEFKKQGSRSIRGYSCLAVSDVHAAQLFRIRYKEEEAMILSISLSEREQKQA